MNDSKSTRRLTLDYVSEETRCNLVAYKKFDAKIMVQINRKLWRQFGQKLEAGLTSRSSRT